MILSHTILPFKFPLKKKILLVHNFFFFFHHISPRIARAHLENKKIKKNPLARIIEPFPADLLSVRKKIAFTYLTYLHKLYLICNYEDILVYKLG